LPYYLWVGFRICALTGTLGATVGLFLLLLLGTNTPILQVGATCFAIGLGMGFVSSPTIVAAQASVLWKDRGVVTSAGSFFRNIGSAFGAAVFGAIANASLGSSTDSGVTSSGHSRQALTHAMHLVAIAIIVVGVLMALAAYAMPRDSGGATELESPVPAA
jgi:MFS family permease